MRVALGKFARWAIEARLGTDLETGLHDALLHYVNRLDSGWRPPQFPRFRHSAGAGDGRADFELEVDVRTRAALEREVRRHGAPLELVAAQAVLVYLAHLDASTDVDCA